MRYNQACQSMGWQPRVIAANKAADIVVASAN